MASALDLPKIEIFDHVNEIIAALCVLRNENGTYSESAQRANPPYYNFEKKCKLRGHQFDMSHFFQTQRWSQSQIASTINQCCIQQTMQIRDRNSEKIGVLSDYFGHFTTELFKTRWSKSLNQIHLTETQGQRNLETLRSVCENVALDFTHGANSYLFTQML